MRNLIGKMAWQVVKWAFKLVTHEKDVLYAYVPLPPGFQFAEVQDVVMGDFAAKSIQLVRQGVELPKPVEAKPAGHQGYF